LTVTSAGPWDKNTEPLHVEGTVSINGLGAPAGTRLLVPIEIFQGRYANVFAAEKRVNIVEFRYPYEEIDDIKITGPAGYTIASLPSPGNVDAGAAVYSIAATQQGNTLEVKRQFAMKGTMFDSKYYASVRALYGKVKADDNAQVILQNSPSAKNN
jgi:hypothetical protein